MTDPSEVSLDVRFWMRAGYCDPRSDNCMEWQGHRLPSGYGQLKDADGNVHYSHRVAYRITVGPIPEGMVVRHRCHNPSCVRPSHLSIGSHGDNARDRVEAGRSQIIDPPCPDTVAAVRHLYASKKYSQGDIARLILGTGAAQPTVARIVSGKTHKTAPGPITRRGRGNPPEKRPR